MTEQQLSAMDRAGDVVDPAALSTPPAATPAATHTTAAAIARLSAEALDFLRQIMANPGGKTGGGPWQELEAAGLVRCVGSYKWEPAFDSLTIIAALAQPAPVAAPASGDRECGNADCGWRGRTNRFLGAIGPLCPECGETTETVAAPAPAASDEPLIIKLGEGLAQVCDDDTYYNRHAHEAFQAYDDWRKRALASPSTPEPAAASGVVADGSTPGAWRVEKRERDGELVMCWVAAPDCNGFAYDAEILGDDEYRDGEEAQAQGMARRLADCELIVKAVNAYRATPASGGESVDAVDAARYRWLRNEAHPDREDTGLCISEQDFNDWGKPFTRYYSGAKLDAAIDAALQATPQQAGKGEV